MKFHSPDVFEFKSSKSFSHWLKRIIAFYSMLALAGCTTFRDVRSFDTDLSEKLDVGDHVVVYTSDGRVIDMTVAYVDYERVKGSTKNGKVYDVHALEINQLKREGVELVGTSLIVIGTIVLLPFAALGAGMAAAD